jgi:hypothetical protein
MKVLVVYQDFFIVPHNRYFPNTMCTHVNSGFLDSVEMNTPDKKISLAFSLESLQPVPLNCSLRTILTP